MDVEKVIRECRIMPLVTLESAESAEILGEALTECGLNIVEVTFRTDAAADAIKLLSGNFPNLLVGAGTVLTTEMVDEAIDAGASYILAPGFNKEVVAYCQAKNIPVYPGCMTPSEIDMAYSMGLRTVKIFPFVQMGGLPMLKAVAAPYKMMRFLVTGGINNENLAETLAYDKIVSCGGSWLIDTKKLKVGDKEGIKKDISAALSLIEGK